MERAFADGYRSRRALPEPVLGIVPTLMMVRDMAVIGWIAGRPELKRSDVDGIKRRLCAPCDGFEPPL